MQSSTLNSTYLFPALFDSRSQGACLLVEQNLCRLNLDQSLLIKRVGLHNYPLIKRIKLQHEM